MKVIYLLFLTIFLGCSSCNPIKVKVTDIVHMEMIATFENGQIVGCVGQKVNYITGKTSRALPLKLEKCTGENGIPVVIHPASNFWKAMLKLGKACRNAFPSGNCLYF